MRRSWMPRDGRPFGPALALVLGLALGGPTPRCAAQSGSLAAAWTPLHEALRVTLQTGRPTVVVATSRAVPASLRLRADLMTLPALRTTLASWQLAELPAEEFPDQARTLSVTAFPTVLILGRGDHGGLKVLGAKAGATDAHAVLGWLVAAGVPEPGLALPGGMTRAAESRVDDAVQRAGYPGDGAYASDQSYPSGQHVHAPPKLPPSPPYVPPAAPQPVYYPQPQYVQQPTLAAPAPVYLQAPTPAMVVQPQQQQIILAPAPPPQITVAMAPPAAPTVSYAPVVGSAPPAASAPPNLLMPAPAPAPPAMAPQPPAMAPQPPAMAPVAMAPQPTAMAPVAMAPQPAVGQGPVAATVLTAVLTNPSLLDRVLGGIGEHFAQKKNPRVQLGQSPFAQAPVAQAPVAQAPVGLAPSPASYYVAIPQRAAAPVAAEEELYLALPPTPGYEYAEAPYARRVAPSPQGPRPGHHGFGHGSPAAPQKRGLFGWR